MTVGIKSPSTPSPSWLAPDGTFLPTHHFVFVRKQWKLREDDKQNLIRWEHVPYLRCSRFTEVAAPEIDEADLHYDFGVIKREHDVEFDEVEPVELYNRYVQVRTLQPGQRTPVVRFTGVIPDDERTLMRPDIATGNQTLKAYGIGFLMDRWYFQDAHVGEQNAPNIDAPINPDMRVHRMIGYLPTFNDKGLYGKPLFGNKTSFVAGDVGDEYGQPYPEDVDPQIFYSFLFSADEDEEWSALNAVDYLLAFRPNAEQIRIELAVVRDLDEEDPVIGAADILRLMYRIWEPNGQSLWRILNTIVDRRYGCGFYMRFNPDKEIWVMEVFSLAQLPIASGNVVLPPNPWQMPFVMPTSYPFTHLVDEVPFRAIAVNRYDTIEARSANIRIMASFACQTYDPSETSPSRSGDEPLTGDLQRAWTRALQQEYEAIDLDDDNNRSNDKYRKVYRQFRVRTDWDVRAKWISGTNNIGRSEPLKPYPQPDGSVVFDPDAGYWSRMGKGFSRDTFLLEGVDYTVFPFVDSNPANTNPGYVPMMAFIFDNRTKIGGAYAAPADHDEDFRWHRVERLAEDFEDANVSGGSVRPTDRELGLEVVFGGKKNHYFALGDFAGESNTEPEFSWTKLVVTGMYETDAKQFVRVELHNDEAKPELTNPLVIECNDCEFWYASMYACIDIAEDGKSLKNIPMAMNLEREYSLEIRNDRRKLQAAVVFAAAWYGIDRQAVRIPIKQVGSFVQLGTMITSIEFITGSAPVRTVVTAKECVLSSPQHTTIETGYVAFDVAQAVDAFMPTKSFAGRREAMAKGRGGQFNKPQRRRGRQR